MRDTELTGLIDRWTAEGVLTAAQAGRMRAELASSGRRGSLVAESVGYLGGALVIVAMSLATGWYWADLGPAGRLGIVGGAAVALVAAGAVVPGRSGGTARRLRAVLWLMACAALFGFLVLLADDPLGWSGRTAVSFAALGVLPCAGVLWFLHRHPVQHVAVFVLSAALAASLVTHLSSAGSLPGVAVGVTGLVWGLLAWGTVVRPASLGRTLGALGTVAGAVAIAGEGWGAVPAVGTVALVIAAAVLIRDLVVLAVGSVGTLLVVPEVVTRYFPGTIGAALALLLAGLLLVAVAVLAARRSKQPRDEVAPAGEPDRSTGPPRIAIGGAALLVAVATVAVVLAGSGLSLRR
ncbi:hypothetical protein [Actinoplanes sp. NPDC049599]|uniref:hypothetical protein n=1 Tax=Actinoplanes sp. NPDC049599 TaxID=3363903 RepID=UPI0037A005E0